jgi:uncharacterized protein YaaW (UPF0174 family)
MSPDDRLLSEDLTQLLQAFPNDALRDLVGILKQQWTLDPFPATRAYEAHNLAEDADVARYAPQVAAEILWWGSHTLLRQLNGMPAWREVVAKVAASIGVPAKDRTADSPAWRVEGTVLRKALSDWEKLTPTQRQEVVAKAGVDFGAARGGALATTGGLVALGGEELLAFLAARGVSFAAAGTIFAPAALVLGTLWTAYDLAGPSYRVLRPVVMTIAYTRQRLRDERAANAFKD